jgi:hypothetical protein
VLSVDHHRGHLQVGQVAGEQLGQRGLGGLDEPAGDRRPRGGAGLGLDGLADGSEPAGNRRQANPASIRASTVSASRSSAATAANVSSATSVPSVVRARGRLTGTRRAPSVTELAVAPCRIALRSGSCLPFGPASAVISACIIACITF